MADTLTLDEVTGDGSSRQMAVYIIDPDNPAECAGRVFAPNEIQTGPSGTDIVIPFSFPEERTWPEGGISLY